MQLKICMIGPNTLAKLCLAGSITRDARQYSAFPIHSPRNPEAKNNLSLSAGILNHDSPYGRSIIDRLPGESTIPSCRSRYSQVAPNDLSTSYDIKQIERTKDDDMAGIQREKREKGFG